MQGGLAAYEEIFRQSSAAIMSQLEAELADRRAEAPAEPELPTRNPAGILAALAPMD